MPKISHQKVFFILKNNFQLLKNFILKTFPPKMFSSTKILFHPLWKHFLLLKIPQPKNVLSKKNFFPPEKNISIAKTIFPAKKKKKQMFPKPKGKKTFFITKIISHQKKYFEPQNFVFISKQLHLDTFSCTTFFNTKNISYQKKFHTKRFLVLVFWLWNRKVSTP